MAQKDITLAVKAKIQADASEMRKVIDDLENTLGNLKPDSNLAKILVKELDKIKNYASDFRLIGEQNIINQADISKAERLAKHFFERVASFSDRYENSPFTSFLLDEDTLKELDKIQKKIEAVEDASQRVAKKSVRQSAKETGGEKAEKEISQLAKSAGILDENISFSELSSALKELESTVKVSLQAAKESLAAGKETLKEAKKQTKDKKASLQSSFYSDPNIKGRVKNFSNKQSGENYVNTSQLIANSPYQRGNVNISDFLKNLVFEEGTTQFKEEGKLTAISLLRLMGIDEKSIPTAAKELQEFFLSQLKEKNLVGKYNQARKTSKQVSEDFSNTVEKSSVYKDVQEKERIAAENVSSAEEEIEQLEELQENYEDLDNRLNQLEQEAFKKASNEESVERDNLRKEARAAQEKDVDQKRGATYSARATAEQVAQDQYNQRQSAREMTEAQMESDRFKRQLQFSVRQWMSAREGINLVKKGIRSAYNDIKSLDKAMTNIAVVTDFSTEDLWGQINDYMAIAKQYGVTTQGVYEVTQLFFQQGLGTSDTMAATVETLKMARIAGISYTDAADGMTVA